MEHHREFTELNIGLFIVYDGGFVDFVFFFSFFFPPFAPECARVTILIFFLLFGTSAYNFIIIFLLCNGFLFLAFRELKVLSLGLSLFYTARVAGPTAHCCASLV